jgi:hypothetical protein
MEHPIPPNRANLADVLQVEAGVNDFALGQAEIITARRHQGKNRNACNAEGQKPLQSQAGKPQLQTHQKILCQTNAS